MPAGGSLPALQYPFYRLENFKTMSEMSLWTTRDQYGSESVQLHI